MYTKLRRKVTLDKFQRVGRSTVFCLAVGHQSVKHQKTEVSGCAYVLLPMLTGAPGRYAWDIMHDLQLHQFINTRLGQRTKQTWGMLLITN